MFFSFHNAVEKEHRAASCAFPCLIGSRVLVIHSKKLIATIDMATIISLGAVNGTRTRDPRLGKPMLYQLSYYRGVVSVCEDTTFILMWVVVLLFLARLQQFYYGNASPRSSTSTALRTVESLRLMYLTCSRIPSR